jgi:hypothetical protein
MKISFSGGKFLVMPSKKVENGIMTAFALSPVLAACFPAHAEKIGVVTGAAALLVGAVTGINVYPSETQRGTNDETSGQ